MFPFKNGNGWIWRTSIDPKTHQIPQWKLGDKKWTKKNLIYMGLIKIDNRIGWVNSSAC